MSLKTFTHEARADFKTVGAVAPSSPVLRDAMIRPLPLEYARVVVEVGCGTGVMTQGLLKRMPAGAKLLGFEINPRFLEHLKSSVKDSRMELIEAGAENLREEVQRRGFKEVDAALSSLPLAFMTEEQRGKFLGGLTEVLSQDGVFTQFRYLTGVQMKNGRFEIFRLKEVLLRYFSSVKYSIVWRNLPPAFVFACRGPLKGGTSKSS